MKQLVYTIRTKQYFDVDSNIDIEDILDRLREMGTAEIVSVELIDPKDEK